MQARDYTNALAAYKVESNGTMPMLRRLSFLEMMSVCEQIVVDKHIAATRPYLKELDTSEERIAYLKAAQADQPAGFDLKEKALDELVSEQGIDAILRYGMTECNPGMEIDSFMISVNDEDKAFIYNVFAADLEEAGKKAAKASGAKKNGKKQTRKTRKPRKPAGAS